MLRRSCTGRRLAEQQLAHVNLCRAQKFLAEMQRVTVPDVQRESTGGVQRLWKRKIVEDNPPVEMPLTIARAPCIARTALVGSRRHNLEKERQGTAGAKVRTVCIGILR